MAFNLQARTIIESATLDLNAKQLQELADAAPYLQEVCAEYEDLFPELKPGEQPHDLAEALSAIEPVMMLLASIASLVDQTGVLKPKRQIKRRKKPANPTTGG